MNDDLAPQTTGISAGRQIVRIVLGLCSASLSVIGSLTILYKILRDRARRRTTLLPYDRIIVGLSCCDIVASINTAIDDFILPSETSPTVWAFGNQATCDAVGFLGQLSVPWAWWYNCLLSFYFLVTVISQLRGKNYVQQCEPAMHLSGLFFPVTAVLGYHQGWYGEMEMGGGCWVEDPVIKWIVGGIPFLVSYSFVIINYSIIYIVVRKSLQWSNEASSVEQVVAGGLTALQERLMREATTIQFLYVGSFFVTTAPTVLLQILTTHFGYTNTSDNIYPLLVFDSALFPLQGFFNVLIYLKPAYTRFRAANPSKPVHFVLHQALFNPRIPRLHLSSDSSISDDANPNNALFNPNARRLSTIAEVEEAKEEE